MQRELHPDPYNLQRFIGAQEVVYRTVIAELRSGQKYTHWMWFIFPQVECLGYSSTSKRYAIKSGSEARAYLCHPTLGARLVECTHAVLDITGRTAWQIFGSPDDLKLQSSMTLFAAITEPDSIFAELLDHYYAGKRDSRTLHFLKQYP